MEFSERLESRPILIVLAGPNGAGKSTFYQAHLASLGLQFLNADLIARELRLDAYAAMKVTASLREELLRQRESFILETVFSDPAADKLAFFLEAVECGYTVALFFIGISGSDTSERRVAQRVAEGGHDVPAEKLVTRFPRVLENLRQALRQLPLVLVFDNDDLNDPYRLIASFEDGRATELTETLPVWLRNLLPEYR